MISHKESDLAKLREEKAAAEARIKALEFEAKRKDELLQQMNNDFVAFAEVVTPLLEGGKA